MPPRSAVPSQMLWPWRDGFDVTPSDSVDFDVQARSLFIGTGGDVAVVWASGNVSVFKNLPDAYVISGRVNRVNLTGTTASDILGLE